jgi:hypothetical protein
MALFLDLSGKSFGKLKVLHLAKKRGKNGEYYWHCICECGRKINVRTTHLTGRKGTKSCGCLASEKKFVDLAGRRFGKLVVLDFAGKNKEGRSLWRVKCDCGRTKVVLGRYLLNHDKRRTRSCGCLQADLRKALKGKWKAKEEIKRDGITWLSQRAATSYLGVTKGTLLKWAFSCDYLNGEGIETRPMEGALNRIHEFYSKVDLNRIRKARAKTPRDPNIPGLMKTTEAARVIGSKWGLQRIRKTEKIASQRIPTRLKNGRFFRSAYVPKEVVTKWKETRKSAKLPKGLISVHEAAEILGIKDVSVLALIRRGVLKASTGKVICQDGCIRKAWILSKVNVSGLRDRRNGLATTEEKNGHHNGVTTPKAMDSAASALGGNEKREPVRPLVVVDEFSENALWQLGISRKDESLLTGQMGRIFRYMVVRQLAQVDHFIQSVWGFDGAAIGTMHRAIHRFNSEESAPFLLTVEDGQILKEKK